jgi:hypothetical protein
MAKLSGLLGEFGLIFALGAFGFVAETALSVSYSPGPTDFLMISGLSSPILKGLAPEPNAFKFES